MDYFYLLILCFLILLAVSDLFVGAETSPEPELKPGPSQAAP
jgi:hypothetical protein